ncbi:hypothetical protein C3747_64g77 [Trypanosoma cruzi]|uniref:Cytidyltransferase-like domain-containing protein n=2 Tax=Trypanosoma cruzi TaxID=5693 RepID=Q4DGH9_TRYCC|nr:hypothetical protein, conserved [Trypanosoma cruzi]EAN91634.1 hypothetical protein, conserved [Trypanosoma cruzi]PWV10957.1 hypothetical protein C3747_64g77 [Trypanosoma cruzi]RNC56797.1 nucleotidyl transferase domain-containing protein [Trypanosoma cruzi]|eukprot:XP_813485.1 hypothetical protein [Trypanosoma cruzi strain CL Brener]
MAIPPHGFIEAIHASPLRCVLYVMGAGSSAIAQLTSVAGCSRTLLDARVPYAMAAALQMLDDQPPKMVSATVARQMAQHAHHRAVEYSNGDDDGTLVGIGSTSAVQTNRIRHGKDSAFVAAWSQRQVVEFAMELPGHLARAEQEEQVTLLLFKALAECAKVPFEISFVVEPKRISYIVPDSPLRRLLQGEMKFLVFNTYGELRANFVPYVAETSFAVKPENSWKALLFPGSFRPLHWGHTELARAAVRAMATMKGTLNSTSTDTSSPSWNVPDASNVQVTYEIAVDNADKGIIDSDVELKKRVQQFLQRGARVAVTRARLFTEKALLFPGHGFIVGIDTMKRILDPKYYDNSREAMLRAMEFIREQGGYFVVAGRASGGKDAVWEDLTSIEVPAEVESMLISIRKEDFCVDVSSTMLRERNKSTC